MTVKTKAGIAVLALAALGLAGTLTYEMHKGTEQAPKRQSDIGAASTATRGAGPAGGAAGHALQRNATRPIVESALKKMLSAGRSRSEKGNQSEGSGRKPVPQ